jgi:hypothetical protein
VPRDSLLAGLDGAVLWAAADGAGAAALASHVAQVWRVAGATLDRAGLGRLRRATIEGGAESTFLRGEGGHVVALTLTGTADAAHGRAEVDRLWARTARARGLP